MSIRTERVAGLIREVIGGMLQRDIDTSGYGLLTVTDVIMAPDLKLAKIYISHYHSDKTNEQVLAFFEEHHKAIRMEIGRSVRLKFTPELRFYIDETLNRVERLEQLLGRIHEEEKNR
ncbi:MAG: 30S ribosome-binding factor RbfA [Ignavibacteriae bacterium]|nr:30S ribosome-binding factor RbfA [Ignavibacteriota bacterium]